MYAPTRSPITLPGVAAVLNPIVSIRTIYSVLKEGDWYWHVGFQSGFEGTQPLITSLSRNGLKDQVLSDFRGNGTCKSWNFLSAEPNEYAVARYCEVADKKYDFAFWNCEHFAYYIVTGVARSPQLETALATAAGVALIAAGISTFQKKR